MYEDKLTPLCQLARKHETDKGGWHYRYGGGDSDTCHNYTPIYYALFGRFAHQVENVLEIGVNSGASLRMWEEFFPQAQVFGIDNEPSTMFSTGRIRTFLADQSNSASLLHAVSEMGLWVKTVAPLFDIIIDDGSHQYEHQIISMKVLLPYLSDRGLYIIEDTTYDCQPEIIGKEVPAGFTWVAIKCGHGFGKAHCDPSCPKCHGEEGERLIVIKRSQEGPCG